MSERVNQRWPDGLKAAVERAAGDRGLDATAFTVAAVRSQLEAVGAPEVLAGHPAGASGPSAAPLHDPVPGGPAPVERIGLDTHVDAHAPVEVALPNAIQLSGRTGLPKATCQKMLDRGEVRWIPRPESSDLLLEVKLNGQWQAP